MASSDKSCGASRAGGGEAATRPAPVMNVMDADNVGRGSTLIVHGSHLGMHVDDDDVQGWWCDLKADGWSTALCECMSPDAKSIFDWGYVCTSCACPCMQFYFNWLGILKGAPVCAVHLKTCRCLLLGPATHTCFMACMMLACLRCQCQGLHSRPAHCVTRLRPCLANGLFLAFCVHRTRDSIAWQAPAASVGTQCMLPV